MSKKGETNFRTRLVKWCKSNLFNCEITTNQQLAIRGTPDLNLTINGYAVWIELKDEDGGPSGLQIVKINNLRSKGKAVAVVAKPSHFPLLKIILRRIDQMEAPKWVNEINRKFPLSL